jgi:phosphatidylglycerol:prolipoprotein diacylglycerol transferase
MTHWFTYPNIDPVAFRLGPLAVHWYGLSYLFGFICVFLWMNRPEGRRRMGLTTDNIQDFLIYALIGVLIGGRLVFVIADVITNHNFADYLANPIDFIAIWKGGMAFHGALVGVIVAIFLFLRKHPGLTFNVLSDEVVVLLPLGIATTRVVNFINDELWGKVCDPDHPWCIKFPAAIAIPRRSTKVSSTSSRCRFSSFCCANARPTASSHGCGSRTTGSRARWPRSGASRASR